MTPAEIEAAAERLVERTCREQNLPLTVTDPAALRRVASLLVPTRDEGAPQGPSTDTLTNPASPDSRCLHGTP